MCCTRPGTYHTWYIPHLDSRLILRAPVQVSRIRPRASSTRTFGKGRGRKDASPTTDLASIDFNRKVLHFAWHPKNYCVAVAGLNNLYIYNA